HPPTGQSGQGSCGQGNGDDRQGRRVEMTTSIDTGDLKRRMHGAVEALRHDLAGLRTGRASTALVDGIQVEVYGANMPLNQVATVSVPEPRLISIQVWDKSNI